MQFKNNVPFIKEGLEVERLCFSGGRIAANVAKHGGLTHLDYYGKQRFCDTRFFSSGDQVSAWAELFRLFAIVDEKIYYLEFKDTRITPHGYESSCVLDGVKFKHSMLFLNDAMVYSLQAVKNPKRKKISACIVHGDFLRINKPSRKWSEWNFDKKTNSIVIPVNDSYSKEEIEKAWKNSHDNIYECSSKNYEPAVSSTFFGITSDAKMNFSMRHENRKCRIDLEMNSSSLSVALAFGSESAKKFKERLADLRDNGAAEAKKLLDSYDKRLKTKQQIKINNATVQSLLMNVPSILDTLKVKDLPGGMRASDSGYWIWGWDSIVHSDAHCFGNDLQFVVEMLKFYKDTAHPEMGVFHAATLEGKLYHPMAFPAQCLYGIMLYNAYVFSGDKKLLKEYLPFAKWILDKAGAEEVADSGLIRGPSMYPDYPGDLGQDGKNDISVFNNSIYYQALRVVSELFEEAGEKKTALEYAKRAEKTLSGWRRFFDKEKGFFYDSLDARNFAPRLHYPSYAILWVTPFAADLTKQWSKTIAKFMKKNLTAKRGVKMLPPFDPAFMRYGHHEFDMYMPVIEGFYRETMKSAKDPQGVSQLIEIIEWNWNQICVPEALTCGYENHGITLDNPGKKQGFCAKSWSSLFYHVICGINLDSKGLSFSPSDPGTDIDIQGLEIRGHKLDIKITGKGWKIKSLTLDGKNIKEPFKISFEQLKNKSKIKIVRGK